VDLMMILIELNVESENFLVVEVGVVGMIDYIGWVDHIGGYFGHNLGRDSGIGVVDLYFVVVVVNLL
jgi:hypothetical protein